jgi:hypothetical protein
MILIDQTVAWLREYVADCDNDSEAMRGAADLANELERTFKSDDPQLYYVVPDGRDDCDVQTSPDPMRLDEIGAHIAILRQMYLRQGYFSNCRQEHIAPSELVFKLVPYEEEERVPDGEDAEEWQRASERGGE